MGRVVYVLVILSLFLGCQCINKKNSNINPGANPNARGEGGQRKGGPGGDSRRARDERNWIDAFGIVVVTEEKNINLDFSASIEKVHVKEGEYVTLNTPLVTLSIQDFQSQIRSKEYELNQAKFELDNENREYQKIKNSLIKAERDLGDDKNELERTKELYNVGAIPKKDLDDAERTVADREKNLDDTRINLAKYESTSKNTFTLMTNKINLLERDVARLKEKLKMQNLQRNTIISDIKNGIVYSINMAAGDFINISANNQQKILSIMDLDTLVVQADVPEEFIKDVKIDGDVSIKPTANLDREYKGKVTRISSMAIKKNSETIIPVEISVDNYDGFLKPNFNVDVKIFY